MLDLTQFVDSQHWFFDYWFKFYYSWDSGLGWVLISMFVAQILTLASGIASVVRNRRILALVAIASSFTTTLLMVEAGRRLYGFDLNFFELGFWLTHHSEFLFIIAFMLSILFKRKQTNP
jgi:hypothetical protein